MGGVREISLALVPFVGFQLHGDAPPRAAASSGRCDGRRAAGVALLLFVGLIGGGPTLFGTLLGQPGGLSKGGLSSRTSGSPPAQSYVVVELLVDVCRRAGERWR